MVVDGALQGVRRGVGDHASLGATAALAHPEDGSLANRAATGLQLLALVLVGFLAAEKGFVYLNVALQDVGIISARRDRNIA